MENKKPAESHEGKKSKRVKSTGSCSTRQSKPEESSCSYSPSADSRDGVALFIDNSNIFIEGQKYHAKHLKLLVPQDPCFRIDIGKLCDALVNGRNLKCGTLYGSEPPSLDTVWQKIREHGLNVSTYQKNSKDKEKEVDHALTADAMKYACTEDNFSETGTIVIVAGDRDYCPVVERILERGWNVEIAAFRSSLSKKLKDLGQSNGSLQIKELNLLLDEQPNCYFVNRMFRSQLPNVRKRIRMPRSRTMVLEFEQEFDIEYDSKKTDDVRKLSQLADKLTELLQVPCRFKPDVKRGVHQTRILFIIGYTDTESKKLKKQVKEVNDSERKWKDSLRKCGIPEDQIKVMIKENQPNQSSFKTGTKIEFFTLWKQKPAIIKETCEELLGTLKSHKTMIEFCQGEEEDDKIPLKNRFRHLSVDDECDDRESESDDTDYDFFSDENDSDDDSDANDFEEVKPKGPNTRVKTFSEPCKYSFCCNNGSRCGRNHTEDELKFFKSNEGHGARGYKSKPCAYYFSGRSCLKGKQRFAPMCSYYHSTDEARCYQCKRFGGMVGHAATECPMLSTLREYHTFQPQR